MGTKSRVTKPREMTNPRETHRKTRETEPRKHRHHKTRHTSPPKVHKPKHAPKKVHKPRHLPKRKPRHAPKKVRVKPFHQGTYGSAQAAQYFDTDRNYAGDEKDERAEKLQAACNWILFALICLLIFAIMGCGGFLGYQKYKPSESEHAVDGVVTHKKSHLRSERTSSEDNSVDMSTYELVDSTKKRNWKKFGGIMKKCTMPVWYLPWLVSRSQVASAGVGIAGTIAATILSGGLIWVGLLASLGLFGLFAGIRKISPV